MLGTQTDRQFLGGQSMTGVSERLKRIRQQSSVTVVEDISMATIDTEIEIERQALLTGSSETAARQSMQKLTSALSKPPPHPDSLAGLVSELLKPMLQEWFNANVPDMVDRLVAQELAKLTSGSTQAIP